MGLLIRVPPNLIPLYRRPRTLSWGLISLSLRRNLIPTSVTLVELLHANEFDVTIKQIAWNYQTNISQDITAKLTHVCIILLLLRSAKETVFYPR